MTDIHTKKQRSYNMSRIKGKNTGPELVLRKFLSAKNIKGYKLNYKLTGKPDIVFLKQKIAIFVDGCFWHKCPKCFIQPKNNRKFWEDKINGNVARDKSIKQKLQREGWFVIRLWEHDIKKDIKRGYILIKNTLQKRERYNEI